MKLKELAKHVPGEVVGDGETPISGVAPIEEARAGDLVFVLTPQLLPSALRSRASALLAPENSKTKNKSALLVKNPRQAMVSILSLFASKKAPRRGIHKSAIVPKSCRIGKEVYIGPYTELGENVSIADRTQIGSLCYIGDGTKIGKECVILPQASLYHDTVVGDRAIVHSGARIGVDGYGFVQEKGKHIKIPQIGNVVIEDDVEIFANTCISRATLGSTIIGAGTKIDNLTHVAHNCKIGKDCAIVSLVGFAGSVTLKDRVYVAGQAGFNGHITIGENTVIMARAGVTKDAPANAIISGFPAQDHHKEIEFQASLRRLAKKYKE